MSSTRQIARRLERLFSFMPGAFSGKKNFGAIMGAIAESDADIENLFIEIKKQLFVETAEGQYLDMLGSNLGVNRPPLTGMVDEDFKEFIKLQTYYPKQIKQLLFRMMELFYGRDTIKANIRTEAPGNYKVFEGANLLLNVDGLYDIEVTFNESDFNDPESVTAEEIAAQINAKVDNVIFAATYRNAIDKQTFLEIYTNTFGPVGSISITGGSANRFLKFPNTQRLGTTIASQYRFVKQNTTMKLYWAGGDNPSFSQIKNGDSALLTGSSFNLLNKGSFLVESIVDTGVPASILAASSVALVSPNIVRYSMTNTLNILEGNEVAISGFANTSNNGTFTVLSVSSSYIDVASFRTTSADDEASSGIVDLLPSASHIAYSNENGISTSIVNVTTVDDVLFFSPEKKKLESSKRPATVWEVNSNEIVIILPATPVVVRRGLAGSAHVQGTSAIVNKGFINSLELVNAEFFPSYSGSFWLQKPNGQIVRDKNYVYSVKSNNSIISISPPIDPVGFKLKLGVGPLSTAAFSSEIVVTCTEPHSLSDGELVKFVNFSSFNGLSEADINSTFTVTSIIDSTSFTVSALAIASATGSNSPSTDKGEIFTCKGSKVVITNVQQNTGYFSSYIYDEKNAPYTISNMQTTLSEDILIGDFGTSISVFNSKVFPENSGEVIFSYGQADEEGPVKYIARPSSARIFIDPSYRFKKSHSSGAAINLVRSPFPTEVSVSGKEYPVYIVDTISPREKLKELLLDAKAAGVSIKFIVVLPDNVYNAFDLYA